ncbi:lipase [Williamsia phyllosphaerae]|uniref:Lipase n=2 Tax=Williamsia phyllosphaerae TaxID=885042 RepID=A0ABQ1V2S3_9NOCA|nr:lipase [Williamsia phyllosphaerae]
MFLASGRGTVRGRKRLMALMIGVITVAGQGVVATDAAAAPRPPIAPSTAPVPLFPPLPDADRGFYLPPQRVVEAAAPGEILAARRVNLANVSVLPVNVDAWQISYRSTNTRGQAIPAVSTVLKPRGAAPGGSRKLLSYQMAEDSTASYCAPSYAMRAGSIPSPLTGPITVPLNFIDVVAAVAKGWAVVVPDHQGPDSAFAAGPLAGRIVLDGIRSAEQFAPLQVDGTATKVGMWGYSGGAIATGWAAELQQSYAPELNVVGVAEGGVPADLGALVNLGSGNLGAGLVMAGVIGVSREYPQLAGILQRRVNPLGKALIAAKNPLCLAYQSVLAPFLNIKGLFVGGDPLRDPTVKSVLAKVRMGQTVPRAPMFVYQSHPDWLVPVGPVDTLVQTYCRDPQARVQYTRDHFSEHISLDPVAAPAALLWLSERFAGKQVKAGCSTTDVGSMALDSRAWSTFSDQLGANVAALFGQAIGRTPTR